MRLYRKLPGLGAFSLIEVLIVGVVVMVVAAVARPRMSRAGASSPEIPEHLLVGRLNALRMAIDAYTRDHSWRLPAGDADRLVRQLTSYTDSWGNPADHRNANYPNGPYLSEIPALPLGSKCGRRTIAIQGTPEESEAAWVYEPRGGRIWANLPENERDADGRPYRSY